MIDPTQLAIRVARRYGKRTRFGKWEKVVKGGHIPLTAFNSRKVVSVAMREMKIENRLTRTVYKSMFVMREFNICDLLPTQPFIRVEDTSILREKIKQTKPIHVRVVTHKGEHYIDDGHHAVMAAKLRGENVIEVNYLNLDEINVK